MATDLFDNLEDHEQDLRPLDLEEELGMPLATIEELREASQTFFLGRALHQAELLTTLLDSLARERGDDATHPADLRELRSSIETLHQELDLLMTKYEQLRSFINLARETRTDIRPQLESTELIRETAAAIPRGWWWAVRKQTTEILCQKIQDVQSGISDHQQAIAKAVATLLATVEDGHRHAAARLRELEQHEPDNREVVSRIPVRTNLPSLEAGTREIAVTLALYRDAIQGLPATDIAPDQRVQKLDRLDRISVEADTLLLARISDLILALDLMFGRSADHQGRQLRFGEVYRHWKQSSSDFSATRQEMAVWSFISVVPERFLTALCGLINSLTCLCSDCPMSESLHPMLADSWNSSSLTSPLPMRSSDSITNPSRGYRIYGPVPSQPTPCLPIVL